MHNESLLYVYLQIFIIVFGVRLFKNHQISNPYLIYFLQCDKTLNSTTNNNGIIFVTYSIEIYGTDITVRDITDIHHADRLRTGKLEGIPDTCQTSNCRKSSARRGRRQYVRRGTGGVIK